MSELQAAQHLAQAIDSTEIEADALFNMACVEGYRGDFAQIRTYAERAQRLYRQLARPARELRVLNLLGMAAHGLGDYVSAIGCFEQALVLCRQRGDRRLEDETRILFIGDLGQSLAKIIQAIASDRAPDRDRVLYLKLYLSVAIR